MKKNAKYIFIGILAILVIVDIVLVYFVFNKKDEITTKTFENKNISFEYTSDYTLKETDENNISLGRDDKSGQIDIIITELSNEVLSRDNGFIIYEATQKFILENEDYYQSYYGKYKTKNYEVNDFLYDKTEGKQVDMNYIIHNNKLVLISYTNDNEYFDLYEPVVVELINSIKIS